jgi:hypothetical protein
MILLISQAYLNSFTHIACGSLYKLMVQKYSIAFN